MPRLFYAALPDSPLPYGPIGPYAALPGCTRLPRSLEDWREAGGIGQGKRRERIRATGKSASGKRHREAGQSAN